MYLFNLRQGKPFNARHFSFTIWKCTDGNWELPMVNGQKTNPSGRRVGITWMVQFCTFLLSTVLITLGKSGCS